MSSVAQPFSVASPFSVAFIRTVAFGTLAGVHLPQAPQAPQAPQRTDAPNAPEANGVPDEIMARLHPLELAFAQTLRGFRQIDWVGGRLAWAAALSARNSWKKRSTRCWVRTSR